MTNANTSGNAHNDTNHKTTHNSNSVIIVGGGVCGLSIGWQLQRMGANVQIFDSSDCFGGVSPKSAGMLAGGIENEPSEKSLWALSKYSQSQWFAFKTQLETDSGITIDYRNHGIIMSAVTADDLNTIQFLYDYQKKIDVPVEWLSARQIKKKEPHLRSVGGMWCNNDHQVDSLLLCKALKRAFSNCGGVIHEYTTIKQVLSKNNTAYGVKTTNGDVIHGDSVVLCLGVETKIDGIDDVIPVRPLKGQMISLRMDKNNPLINHVIWAPKTYIVPKSNGELIIGATVEEQGFNDNITAGGVLALLESAWQALPAIEDLPMNRMWVGHRPTARDDAPILGRLSMENTFIATGHHRNGILLAPATGILMAKYILTGLCPDHIKKFSIDRFTINKFST